MKTASQKRNARQIPVACVWMMAITASLATGLTRADVIYDTTAMTDNQAWTFSGIGASQSYIGGALSNSGTLRDENAADDFSLSAPHLITTVTADFVCLTATPPIIPAGGILVEIFSDTGSGHPSEVPTGQFLATAADYAATTFNQTVSTSIAPMGLRFTIDLTNANITLGPGTWWLSVVAIDETSQGRRYFWVSRAPMSIGLSNHRRNGGVDHGNGYSGTSSSSDWNIPIGMNVLRDISMKIEGTPVTVCPADIDGNSVVNVSDLLAVINAWGQTGGPADVNGDGIVNVSDLLAVIAAWGPCS
jgi:hypothetical protein